MPHSVYSQIKAAISRVIHGEMYLFEFVGFSFQQLSNHFSHDRISKVFYKKGLQICVHYARKRLYKYFNGKGVNFNGVLLPDVRSNDLLFAGLSYNYNDLFKIHCEKSGDYSYQIVDPLDIRLSEGTYFYLGSNNEKIFKDEINYLRSFQERIFEIIEF